MIKHGASAQGIYHEWNLHDWQLLWVNQGVSAEGL
jgi:hypothetical protein